MIKIKRTLLLCLILISCPNIIAYAQDEKPEYVSMYTTAYCQGQVTASGEKVREGICAVNRERMGLTAIVYENNEGRPGELLGIYECLDTGFGGDADGDGIGSIEEGKCIDIYFKDLEGCKEWMRLTGGKCYVQFVRADG